MSRNTKKRLSGRERLPLSVSRTPVLIEGSDSEFRRLIYRMIISEGRLVELRRAIAKEVGVTGAQYLMLMAILHVQGVNGVSVGDLADYLEVTGPHITGEIRKLSEQGLVSKRPNPCDGRGVLIRLTPMGQDQLLSAFDFIRGVNDILFDGVTADEFCVLTNFYERFTRNSTAALDFARTTATARVVEDMAHRDNGVSRHAPYRKAASRIASRRSGRLYRQ